MEINPYEKLWIGITVAAILVMLAAITLASFGLGASLPGASGSVDPRILVNEPPFNTPGLYQLTQGKYQAIILAYAWAFKPNIMTVPVGSEITFKVTSKDVTHGMMIEGTNVNLMILPGQVSVATHKFDKPGTYLFVCHEYCGVGHRTMSGKIIVTP
jgi:cytochrome c oxidase subunit II